MIGKKLVFATLFATLSLLPIHGFAAPELASSCAADQALLRSIASWADIENIIEFRTGQVSRGARNTERPGGRESLIMWKKLARKGVSNAQFMTGVAYLMGRQVDPNPKEALRWFLMASQNGDVEATFIVAYMYATGSGTRADYCKAKEWFCAAGAKGIEEAKYAMGTQCDE